MGTSGPYSELEYLVLGLVSDGVTSGYAMRKRMNRMRGGRWSSESGSIYRVLKRLENDRLLVEARRVGVPNRERTEFEVTEQGRALLNSWLTFPPDRAEVAFLVDPIRTRSYFLTHLKPSEQVRVVKSWQQENKHFIADLQRDIEALGDTHSLGIIAYSNLLHLALARSDWLKKLLAEIRNPAGEGTPAASAIEEEELEPT